MSLGRQLADRLSLIVITDPAATGGPLQAALASLAGGAPAVQLRWKGAGSREMLDLARELRQATLRHGALFFVNDRVDVAVMSGADGAHLGDDDIPIATARLAAPPGFIIGRSADTPEDAERARFEGADYVGIGPVYATGTKEDAGAVIGLEGLGAFRRDERVPLVGIGGITTARAGDVLREGVDGVAVIGAVMFAPDPAEATRQLLLEIERARIGRKS